MSPTRSSRPGGVCGGEAPRRAAARRSARRRASGRAGPQRTPEVGSASSGQPQAAASRAAGSATSSTVGPQTIAPRGVGGDAGGELLDVVGVGRGGVLAQLGPGTAVRAALPVGGVERLGLGRERLAQREVEVHRAGPLAGGGPVGAAGERAVMDRRLAAGLVGADLDEPLDRAPVELQLVDRLAGADLAQLGRAVGGEHDQGHARLQRLDHGGMQVRGRRTRGAGDGDGPARRLGHAEREEAGAALVEHRDRLELGSRRRA